MTIEDGNARYAAKGEGADQAGDGYGSELTGGQFGKVQANENVQTGGEYGNTGSDRPEWNAEALLAAARDVRERAYAPYSGFAVGAAFLDASGRLHAGCNVENAAYGPTNCAERTALFRAIADGVRPGEFVAAAVIADTDAPITPCGVCRQVMVELCSPDMPVVLGNLRGDTLTATVADLLPGAFSKRDLASESKERTET